MKKQYCFTPKQCVAGAGSATPLREEDFRATKQIKFVAKQCCNFKKQCCFAIKQCCFAIKQCIAVTDRIVLATKRTVGVTRITVAVRALPVSVAKKSIMTRCQLSLRRSASSSAKANLVERKAHGRSGNGL